MKRFGCVFVVLVSLISGCTTNVIVGGSVPTPLVQKLPADVAVFYSENFKTFIHEESLKEDGTWKIDMSDQNLNFFRSLMTSMFDSVVEIDSPELNEEQKQSLDGLLIPKIEKYGFLTPGISGLKFFSASIHYKISVFNSDNVKVADYVVVGYGKSEGGTFGSGKALGKATMLAIRDGGTRIALDLRQQPAIISWLAQNAGEAP